MSVKRMLKEEWRMHSRLYSGRSFALFPVAVFGLSLMFSAAISEFSSIANSTVSNGLAALSLFLGLGVGTIGFSAKDASKNVLGDFTLLIHSSRTLPTSRKRLLAEFVVKDLLYYTMFFMVPLGLGFALVSGVTPGLFRMLPAFVAGLVASFVFARSSIQVPSILKPSYSNIGQPLVQKSELDLERSTGGLLKLVVSFTVLAGFYWAVVLNFPIASIFLLEPLVCFSILIGTMSLSAYNWLNRFDEFKDYEHLPVLRSGVLEAKQKAFVRTVIPFLGLMIAVPYIWFSGQLIVSLVTAASTSTYMVGVASYLFGLEPNVRVYDGKDFMKLVLASGAVTVPLLILAIAGTPVYSFLLANGLAAMWGVWLCRKAGLE